VQHLAGAAGDLAADQERDQDVGQLLEVSRPADEVVLVAAIGVARRVGVVLEDVDLARDALVGEPLLGVGTRPSRMRSPALSWVTSCGRRRTSGVAYSGWLPTSR
jgi:hypothetical protein